MLWISDGDDPERHPLPGGVVANTLILSGLCAVAAGSLGFMPINKEGRPREKRRKHIKSSARGVADPEQLFLERPDLCEEGAGLFEDGRPASQICYIIWSLYYFIITILYYTRPDQTRPDQTRLD